MRIDTRPRPITEENKASMLADLQEALEVAQESIVIRGEILNGLHGIRHHKTANKNVATHLSKVLPDLHVSCGESYSMMRLYVSWEPHNYKAQRKMEWRFEKGDSVQQLIDVINKQEFETRQVLALQGQIEKFDLILAGELELREMAWNIERAQDEIKSEVFGSSNGGYFLEAIRGHLTALCAS